VARDSFWELLIDLSRKQGVTIFVTTHFMNEGMRCDRISLMNAGKVLACDAPQKLIEQRGAASLEDAFIGYMEDSIAEAPSSRGKAEAAATAGAAPRNPRPPRRSAGRAAASKPARWRCPDPDARYTHNETMQILRDPIRLTFAFVGSALLMLVCGFGITTDVEHIRYATFDQDQSPESRAYLEQFAGSTALLHPGAARALRGRCARAAAVGRGVVVLEMPPNFGRDLRRASGPRCWPRWTAP
jgi:ribosome-dependent ATPase